MRRMLSEAGGVCVCAHHADLRRAAERALKVQHGARLVVRSAPHALRLPTRRAPTRFIRAGCAAEEEWPAADDVAALPKIAARALHSWCAPAQQRACALCG